jgi:nitrate/nitrite transporter NarK
MRKWSVATHLISGNQISIRILPSAIGFLASLGSVGAAVLPWFVDMLAEHIGLWSLMPNVIILTAAMVCLWQALHIRPKVPQMSLEELD